MGTKILAVLENSIGPRLLLPTRLAALGYSVTVLSSPVEASRRIGTETFDWLILDEAAAWPEAECLLKELPRRHRTARIVWLGRLPSRTRVPVEASFAKPLDYGEIVRFFSQGACQELDCSMDRFRGNVGPGAAPAGSLRVPLRRRGDGAWKARPKRLRGATAGAEEGGGGDRR